MRYRVRRWDNWSECNGKRGLDGLEELMNSEAAAGWRLSQLVSEHEEIFVLVFERSAEEVS